MMTLLYLAAFVVILSIVVVVHEGGHFLVARLSGVQVTAFSVGFGPKLFSWKDKHNTEWKICAVPLGGYVQMLGDEDAASMGKSLEGLTEEEKKRTFMAQPLYKRAAIIFAGPFMNYVLAVLLLTGVLTFYGYPILPAVIGSVIEGSAAEEAGILAGDKVLSINGEAVETFDDMRRIIIISDFGKSANVEILRDGEIIHVSLMPRVVEGSKVPMLGVLSEAKIDVSMEKYNPFVAFVKAVAMTGRITADTTVYLGQVLSGRRSADDMRGPLGIAEASGDAARAGFVSFIMFLIQVSIGIGFINLLPIPLLDGGHLAMYGWEAVFRRPLGEKAQNVLMRVGIVLLLSLFIFTLWKDIPRVFERIFS